MASAVGTEVMYSTTGFMPGREGVSETHIPGNARVFLGLEGDTLQVGLVCSQGL